MGVVLILKMLAKLHMNCLQSLNDVLELTIYLEAKNELKNGNLDLNVYKGCNGKFWLRNLVLPICVTDCHTDSWGGGKAVMGGYSGVVIQIPILVLPVLLCLWRMMMMMLMRCSKDLQWWCTLLQWMMEDLQWFDTSLGMNEMTRTYNGGMPHSLLGGGRGGVITSHISLMGHGVGPLSFPFGSSSSATEVNFTWQQLGQLLGPHLKHSASLLGSATIEKLAFEMEPNSCSQKLGGSIPWFPCKRQHSGE